MKTLLLHRRLLPAVACLLAGSQLFAGPSGLTNPGFETVLQGYRNDAQDLVPYVPGTMTYGILPGWGLYRPRPDGSSAYRDGVWSLIGTLAGWAEPFVIDSVDWSAPAGPLAGGFSIGLRSGAAANELSSSPEWSWLISGERLPPFYVGRVGIRQAIGLPADITELTCYYADLSQPGYDDGSLVLSFNQQALNYTLEPTVGPHGPTTLLRADLTPVAGQYGELRIGIEGRGFFIVDDLVVVPEASTVAGGLVSGWAALAFLARRSWHQGPGKPAPRGKGR